VKRRGAAAKKARSKRKAGRRMMTTEDPTKNPGGNGPGTAADRKKGGAPEAGPALDAAGGGNLEKIRDILFGAQVTDFEKRFARLEERLLKETSDSRAEAKKRFDSLEAFIRKEVESLSDRVKAEQGERTESGKELSREIREAARSLEKKIAQLDDVTTKSQRELRQQILDQSKALTEEIRNRIRETATTLSREIKELRVEKTDRSALAGVFTEAAMRLTGDLKQPGKE
jgi:phage host-nuclease inhibitor protein Gam